MQSLPFVSVVIPIEEVNDYLRESICHLLSQSYKNFEILIFVTKDTGEKFPKTKIIEEPSLTSRPAEKRDLALKHAKGEILAFIDDDVYPSPDWLKNAVKHFRNPKVAAVGGPMLTPPDDGLMEKAGGWVWASWLGSGGAGTYRCLPQKQREVDDYPTANLLVRRSDFRAVSGFDSKFFPGEDTKLCLDLTRKLKKKIIYDPRVSVYHHRRALFTPHLRQIRGYGLHRGYFARILPETSRRLGYFMPTFFTLGLFLGPVVIYSLLVTRYSLFTLALSSYFLLLTSYFLLLFLTGLWVAIKSHDFRLGILVIPGIFLTHIYYGIMFIVGFFSKDIKRNIHPFFWKN